MKNAFFAMVSRMRYINRWSLMRNTLSENLEEHSFQVAVIAHAIAVIRQKFFAVNADGSARVTVDPHKAAVYAIYHDMDEILVGDMPTPVKYFNKDIEKVFKNIEKDASERLVSTLPGELRGVYGDLLSPDLSDTETAETMKIVKAADKISALVKCIEEGKAGNTEFVPAARKLQKTISRMELPEVGYFMDEFVPAYSCTLDELEKDSGE